MMIFYIVIMTAYREEIKFFSRIFLYLHAVIVIAGLWMVITGISPAGWAVLVAVVFPLLFGRLLITVTHNKLHISFGYLDIIKKVIPLSDIQDARVVEYRPIRQFGGWGIRCGKFEGESTACYNLKGNRGLLLILKNKVRACLMKTDRVIIGCNEPEKLKASIGR